MANDTKPKKVRAILREIQEKAPHVLKNDNQLLMEVWIHEGCTSLLDIYTMGSSAGTILRARNYILNEDRRG